MNENKQVVNIGVIGIGRMGGKHAKNIAKGRVKNAVLVAVCDVDIEKLSKFKDKYNNVATFTDYNQMILDNAVDAVIIATEHYFHTPIAIDCLKQGKHILVEKPVAVTVGEAKRLNETAKLYPQLKYAIMYNQRTNRMYKNAKGIIDRGELGEVRRINYIITDWYRSQAYYNQGGWRASWSGEGGGALINQCIHQLDIVQWLCGMPESVYAFCNTRDREITVENEVSSFFYYKNGAVASFSAATNELTGTNRLEIAGDNGRIIIERLKMRFIKNKKSQQQVNKETKSGYGFSLFTVKRKGYGISNMIKDITIGQQINIIRNFTKAIRGEEELISKGKEGINALSLINAIYLSADKEERVMLPLNLKDYDEFLQKKIEEEREAK